MLPCFSDGVQSASTLSLVFNYDGDLSQSADVETQIRLMWSDLPSKVKTCFDALHFVSSNLSATETKYPIGPCLQFQRTFSVLEKLGFSHWLQFEPDVEPVRSGWGTRLIDLANHNDACRDWWQLGSSPMYEGINGGLTIDNSVGIDLHLNGNAVYCLNSPAFSDYRTLVSRSFPQNGCVVIGTDDSLAGYDHALYRFRQRRENDEYMKGKFSYFRDDAFIKNFGPSSFDAEALLKMSPATMLVHSSYKFANAERKKLLDQKYLTHDLTDVLESSYKALLGRATTKSEKDFFLRVLQPTHSESSSVLCLLSKLFSLCGENKPVLGYCAESDLSFIFPTNSEAVLTAHYIVSLRRLPGPEALELLHAAERNGGSRFMQRLCSAQLPDINSHTLKKNAYQDMSAALLNSNNHVLVGSYQLACAHQRYDNAEDVLLCEVHGTVLSLRRPFRCAEDISVNSVPVLVC